MSEEQLVEIEGQGVTPEESFKPVHPAVDPNLALPAHLQEANFEEDVWRRMMASKIRNPWLNQKNLRDDAEKRELLASAISAASEREKEVLMHNQARVFTGILHSVAKSIQTFMNEPIAPKSWVPPGESSSESANDSNGHTWFNLKAWLVLLLTPKVFLTIIALGFGALAGYSQLQIENLNSTIATYEKALESSNANSEALDKRILDFDNVRAELNKKLADKSEELTSVEKENIKLRAESSAANQKIRDFEVRIAQLQKSIELEREGKVSTNEELNGQLVASQKKLSSANEKVASLETKLVLLEEAYLAQQNANTLIREESQRLDSELIVAKTDAARLDGQLANVRSQIAVLDFAERALKDLKQLAQRYSAIRDDHVLEHITRYEGRKERHLR